MVHMMENLYEISKKVASELIEKAKLQKGHIVVIGCSTSEVVGDPIGTNSNPEAAEKCLWDLRKYLMHKVFIWQHSAVSI